VPRRQRRSHRWLQHLLLDGDERELPFKLVTEPCKDTGLRNRSTVLISHPWHEAA